MKSKNKKLALISVIVLVIAGVAVFYALNRQQSNVDSSTPPTAKSDFTSNDNTKQENATDSNNGTATVKDNGGQTSGVQTVVAQSEFIKLFSPAKNSVVSTGTTIAGESSLEAVSYRINDNVTGQISYGQLQVKDGKFSGTITVNTQAREGQIDVFGTKDGGNEFSNISIPVRFK